MVAKGRGGGALGRAQVTHFEENVLLGREAGAWARARGGGRAGRAAAAAAGHATAADSVWLAYVRSIGHSDMAIDSI